MMLCAACVASAANYLTFTAKEDGSSFGIVNMYNNNPDVQYSLDGGATWTALAGGETVTLAHRGDKALLKGENPEGFSTHDKRSYFRLRGEIAASGSVMSLIDGTGLSTEIPCDYCFEKLFGGCTSLRQAPELPATTLTVGCYSYMFENCTNLNPAPELPATTLAEGCYEYMFKKCESLSQAPALPSTTLAKFCYRGMFFYCPILERAPKLPATTLMEGCYAEMFLECKNLSEINVSFEDWSDSHGTDNWVYGVARTGTFICPNALAQRYDDDMIPVDWTLEYNRIDPNYLTFTAEEDGSTFGIVNYYDNNPDVQYSLDGGETWSALTEGDMVVLAHKGDNALLRGDNPQGFSEDIDPCSTFKMTGKVAASGSVMSLIDGIGFSTEIPRYCFCRLFKDCASLTQAPELPATTLAEGCYEEMFSGCTSLTQAPELPATTLTDFCYYYMFSGCTSLSEINVSFDVWSGRNNYTIEWVKDVAPTGTFVCSNALPLEYGEDRIPEGWTLKYIEDEANYLTFTAEEDSSSFGIVNKGNNPNVQYSLDGGKTWIVLAGGDTVVLAHKGDKALLRGDNPKGLSKRYNQFSTFNMTGKVAASGSVMSLVDGIGLSTEIPSELCFYELFYYCTSLTQAPELPATTLADYCYSRMFAGCSSLTKAPELPATTLDGDCYKDMFLLCTSLTQAPALPATTLEIACYSGMFWGCSSLTQAPELPATNLAGYCYDEMFERCTSLTQAPELPATTLAERCYNEMFLYCTSLTQTPELPATTLAESCYSGMFFECTSLTQAPELPATNLVGHCYYEMFERCTSLTQAPELPATTLAEDCYSYMFSGCTSLSQINVSFDDWNYKYTSSPTAKWVADVAPTGTFICPKALALEYGEARIPEGWTVKYIDKNPGVSSTLADGITVRTDGLTVHVCGAEGEVSLYDLSGKRVAVSVSADEERALSVPAKGVYVVRTNGGSSVVLVR